MTDILSPDNKINRDNLALLHATLIPECTNTHGYSEFQSGYAAGLSAKLSVDQLIAISDVLSRLATALTRERHAIVAAFEQAQPALFRRLYADLITYFYSTQEAAERARQLADAAPREASPHFDPTLVRRVIATQAGKRRL